MIEANTNNKEYWENYVTYWERKVDDANSENQIEDKTSDDLLLKKYVSKLNLSKEHCFLDYGCGSGRMFPIYQELIDDIGKKYYGCDISSIALGHCLKKYSDITKEQLFETDGKIIPFEDEKFDKIACFGVFDACDQENTLVELLRVLKVSGTLLLTGKNITYCKDDKEAEIAEINARKKGHPNSFTDVLELIRQLEKNGCIITEKYFFEKRGDFPLNKPMKFTNKHQFYEWCIYINKIKTNNNYHFIEFSSQKSKR